VIKINLIREARTARAAAAAPGVATPMAAAAPANINNMLVLALLITGLVIGGGYWLLKKRTLSSKEKQVAVRREEAQKLEAIIKEVEDFQKRKQNLEQRIALINDLKKNQKGPVRVMDRISQDLPDLVWLDRMTLNGTNIAVEGRGLNPNAVATFVENIKADPMFDEPEVSTITQEVAGPNNIVVYKYQMAFNFTYQPPGTAPAAGQPGTAAAPGAAPGQ
jgi:type IV pilus assembly protein PilN